jgi:putative membrane protein
MHDGNWHDGLGDANGWWLLMVIMMVAFWGGLIWIGISLLRHNHHAAQLSPPNAQHIPQRVSPQEILAERLARGEIDADEYRQRLDVLREPPSS